MRQPFPMRGLLMAAVSPSAHSGFMPMLNMMLLAGLLLAAWC